MPPLPRVSIIIPVWNAARWLEQSIGSARGQTWPNKELIIVDDGSADGSLPMARRFAGPSVHVVSQPNRGAASARNAGVRIATGDFLQFLDADDLLAPDKIERQLELAARIGDEFAICGRWSRFTRTVEDAAFPTEPLCADASPVDWMITKLEQHRMMHPAAWLVSRRLAERAGPWNEALTLDDDGEYFSRVVLGSSGIRCCEHAVSYYRSNLHGSLSRMKSDRAFASALRSLELTTRRLIEVEHSPRTRHACAVALQRYIYEAYPHAPGCRQRARDLLAQLGGCALQPEGGPLFQRTRRLLGWRTAKRLQLLTYALRRARS